MLFKPKRPVDEDEWEWLLAGFKWLERQYPELAESRRLALPTRDFFPPISARGVQLGEQLMAQVKAIGGIGDWPGDPDPGEASSPRSGQQRRRPAAWQGRSRHISLGPDRQGRPNR